MSPLAPHLPAEFPTRQQLMAAGFTRALLEAAISRGDLHRIFPAVYASRPRALLDVEALGRAAQVYARDRLTFTCMAAAGFWGLIAPPRVLHANVDRPARVRSTSGLVVHQLALSPDDVRVRSGLTVVSRPLAVVQSYACLPADERGAFILEVTQRRLIKPAELLPHVPKNLSARGELLELLHLGERGVHSLGELELLRGVFQRHGLPEPELQVAVELPSGRNAYLDAGYRGPMIGIEYDSVEFHFNAAARNRDLARDAELASLGWLILRCTQALLRARRGALFAEQVIRAVQQRGGF